MPNVSPNVKRQHSYQRCHAFFQAKVAMAKGMACASVLDWSLFCGLEICGLFDNHIFNVSFYGFASTGYFFFSSVCLLLS